MKTIAINLLGFVLGLLGTYFIVSDVTFEGLRNRVFISLGVIFIAMVLIIIADNKKEKVKQDES